MRIVFMGTPDFAVPSLQALLDAGHEVCAVYTQPDKPQGRKQVLTAPPVKELALRHGIPVYQPQLAAYLVPKKNTLCDVHISTQGKLLVNNCDSLSFAVFYRMELLLFTIQDHIAFICIRRIDSA